MVDENQTLSFSQHKSAFNLSEVVELQTATVARWHEMPVDNPYSGILKTICQQHSFNYLLWHEEDIARSPDVTDMEIARVKRSIDQLNQNRNDWIEKIDDELTTYLQTVGVPQDSTLPINTETPGSVVDRLSIMALRIYHLDEQLDRTGVSQDHLNSVQQKVAICRLQQVELKTACEELLSDIHAGRKQHRTYRQFKMYNDPSLNPYLYNRPVRKAG